MGLFTNWGELKLHKRCASVCIPHSVTVSLHQRSLTVPFNLQTTFLSRTYILNVLLNLSIKSFESQPKGLTYSPKSSCPQELTPSAAVHSTNPVCSFNNSTISGNVWWVDGRPLLSVVLWLWLSVVLHYSWMVIRLIALHWKGGWTKPPPEPTDSRESVKCWV